VFETYTAMLGLKLQKKFGVAIKTHLDNHLLGDNAEYSVLFSEEDGLWHVNFPIDFVHQFHMDMSLQDAYELIYRFLFALVEAVEDTQ
ncbi:MAG: branched-chain amino acid aminotransferase, partial [Bacilli bacterium]|nr:branched-chain amino acid aminotransferase [Bacilli bacterium]